MGRIVTVPDGAGRSVTVSNWGVAQTSRHRITYNSSWRISLGGRRHIGAATEPSPPPLLNRRLGGLQKKRPPGLPLLGGEAGETGALFSVGLQMIHTDGFSSPAHLEREKHGLAVLHPLTAYYTQV